MAEQLEFLWEEAPVGRRMDDAAPPAAHAPRVVLPPREILQQQANVLRHELAERTGLDVHLRVTNNSSTMMSLRYDPDGTSAKLSVHHMFLSAPPKVKLALVRWLMNPKAKKSGDALDAFIREHKHQVSHRKPRKVKLRRLGRHHDLSHHFDTLNAAYFEGAVDARITWGRLPARPPRRSIRFGSYTPEDNLIRVHPYLDQEFVPAYFVRYIVFHEMLHAFLGIVEHESGRRSVHSREFRELEQAYPDFERADAWAASPRNLGRLLRGRRVRG